MSLTTFAAPQLQNALLLMVPLLPLVTAAALLSARWRERVVQLAPWASVPALIVAGALPEATLGLPWLLLGSHFGVDDVGRVFLVFTAILWLTTGIYGRSYLADDPRRARFFFFYLLTMSGNLGLIIAQDVSSFYLFFALMSFSSYGLIAHKQNVRAMRAGRIYIYLVVLGEALLFAGILMGVRHAGVSSLNDFARTVPSDLVVGLLLMGFGIKAGALPLHVWLPLAHPVAPTPASAVLSGAIIKAGLLGWVRFLPLGQMPMPEWSVFCVAGGLGAAIYGVVVGVCQDEPKTVLAYSSISQMGLMLFAVGVGMAVPAIWSLSLSVILIYALHHAFAKGALFLGVGLASAAGSGALRRKLVFVGMLLPALALAGLPFTSGAIAKNGLKELTGSLPPVWHHWVAVFFPVIAIGTTVLMARFLYLVRRQAPGKPEITPGLWLPWGALLIGVAFGTQFWREASDVGMQTFYSVKFWPALWPVAVGAVGASLAFMLYRRGFITFDFRIPAGDLLGVAVWMMCRVRTASSLLVDRYHAHGRDRQSGEYGLIDGFSNLIDNLRLRHWLQSWSVFGILFLLIIILIFASLAFV